MSVRGAQRASWIVRLLRARASVRRRIRLEFPRPASATTPTFVVLTIEARSRRGKLLGRLRVRVRYAEVVVGAQPAAGGTTVGWGVNSRGELGAGFKSAPVTHPVQGPLLGVREIAAGYTQGYALLNDGTLRAWGGNAEGQVGDGTRLEKPNPVSVLGLSHVVQIAASASHALALLADGTVFAWGGNFWGTLGNGTRDTVEGTAHPVPQQVPGLSGVVAVAAGGADDIAILSNGTVLGWGEDKNGQLGDGSKETKLTPTPVKGLASPRSVVLGGVPSLGAHMLALLRDGRVMAAGQNDHGQLGLGDTEDRLTPVVVPGLENVASVSASGSHSLAILSGGQVVSWGTDADGELGYPAPQKCGTVPCAKSPHAVAVANASAVSAGQQFSVAVSGGRVLAWGNNELGQLGDGTTAQSTAPTEVPGITGIASVAAAEKFTIALVEQGPTPDFVLRSGPGELIAEWKPLPGSEPWAVSWRVASRPLLAWGKAVKLPSTAQSYVISGLSKVLYEVRLQRPGSGTFGYRISSATPG